MPNTKTRIRRSDHQALVELIDSIEHDPSTNYERELEEELAEQEIVRELSARYAGITNAVQILSGRKIA